jgi:hypothetical protein
MRRFWPLTSMSRLALTGVVVSLSVEICDTLFFELNAGISECFKVNPGIGHRLVGSFEADGSSEGIETKVISLAQGSAQQRDLWRTTDLSGKFDVESGGDGVHQLCFTSTVSDKQIVSFNFHVDEHGGDDVFNAEHKEFVTKEHTDQVLKHIQTLADRTNDILDQQVFAITREAVHRQTAESTNSRVMWWTFAEVLSLIVLATFQVFYLKSFFEVKQVI